MTPADPELYEAVKKSVNQIYAKHSAYRSMAYIKEYKRRDGKFLADGKPQNLKRWQDEKWADVNPDATATSYPVFRPTVRIDEHTPTTVHEISMRELQKQSKRKQQIKGTANLKPFVAKKTKPKTQTKTKTKTLRRTTRKS
jgi:hypothetical protein